VKRFGTVLQFACSDSGEYSSVSRPRNQRRKAPASERECRQGVGGGSVCVPGRSLLGIFKQRGNKRSSAVLAVLTYRFDRSPILSPCPSLQNQD